MVSLFPRDSPHLRPSVLMLGLTDFPFVVLVCRGRMPYVHRSCRAWFFENPLEAERLGGRRGQR